ncbi:BZ3500_MvSof-1268-A1-R1_Chr1-3g01775 [Microbotryum saponariae]|uniref:BZ3500_MvSof-1268-A1-R1_Chr1-3g01775 protein n=1 Tax=Microbotryum saponariae TaxID=289078 RepID=A0A2X0KNT0_9BASI|nr:BZ3500_MvSof-1268-A1-R1_Chr1-3g01775 [Microbotryum saponariae]SCZ94557.1 BZ3501_MvSof-1269-A2-R1_Chr1-3g01377 [Microbotryum saponariae]
MTTRSASNPPQPFSSPSDHSKGIHIADWTIETVKKPILSATDADNASSSLHLPLPEICFGNNRLTLTHHPTNLKIECNCLDALRAVASSTQVKVAHAAEWSKAQESSSHSEVTVQKPYDWTYTSLHPGTISSTTSAPPEFTPAPEGHPGIPLHLLARQDIPILFFDEVPLFEDELGDNGTAELVVRVRVNSFSIFVLSRLFIRVDHVLFRIFDVRTYVPLTTPPPPHSESILPLEIIQELKGRQASYTTLKSRLEKERGKGDLALLTDVGWVGAMLDKIGLEKGLEGLSVSEGEGEGSKGGKEEKVLPSWDGEGTTLQVLRIG